MNTTEIQLNEHNKTEYPPMHTAEHLLNATMNRMLGCGRAVEAHIERKKSKCDYVFSQAPTDEQIKAVEDAVNEAIEANYPVTYEYISREEAELNFDLNRLPDGASDLLRIVRIGDYDACPCVGLHVASTAEIGRFTIISHDYANGRLRLRFKLK
ncbi:MAG: hypothetical protein IKM35_03280 [Bacteroidaceae bacterium]|nr:hypothetical protein [Bacteroidaceae bacterium]